jgi:hypothetical protein
MHIADCMSRNPLEDSTEGRNDHAAPSGIWLSREESGNKEPTSVKEPARWELNCKYVVPQSSLVMTLGLAP